MLASGLLTAVSPLSRHRWLEGITNAIDRRHGKEDTPAPRRPRREAARASGRGGPPKPHALPSRGGRQGRRGPSVTRPAPYHGPPTGARTPSGRGFLTTRLKRT
ncbi:hypothetical protein GCM10010236_25640 [Streptomyces eurythermus]|nr:hypothetical protein GCM10010236_25640 [Streptomyces eurythermus]